MMTDNRKQITVGIFIAIGIFIFILGVFTLGSQKKTFVKSFSLAVVFSDIQGLKKGNNVWFSGVKVGTIRKIEFIGNSKVKVLMSIEEDIHKYIHKDAGASIGADGLIGNKIVVLTGGNPKFPFVEDGDVLQVNSSLSTDDIMKTLQVNNKNLVDVTTDFKVLSRNLVEGKGAAGALLSDEQLARDFKTIVSNLNRTSMATTKTALALSDFSAKLNTKNGLANKILTDTAVFARLERSVSSFEQTARAASAMSGNLQAASAKLNQSDNAAGLLLNDPATAQQVKNIMLNLEKSSKKLDEDLEALQSNFLLRGFFKKRAKDSLNKK